MKFLCPGIKSEHARLKRNFQSMPGAAWLTLFLQHVPDRGEHLVRYYGGYSNRSRGDRIRNEEDETAAARQLGADPSTDDLVDPEYRNAARSAWAQLIKKVYAVDPLICPHCGGELRFLAVIEEAPVIQWILRHLPFRGVGSISAAHLLKANSYS